MGSIFTLAAKDLKLLFRDKFGLFWIFAFPLMYAAFFGIIFGGDGGDESRGKLSIAIVDEDQSDGSRRLIDELDANSAVRLAHVSEDDTTVVTATLDDAKSAVRRGKSVAYLLIPKGYGDEPFALFSGGEEGAPTLEVGIDPSRSAEKGMLQGVLTQSLFASMTSTFTDKTMIHGQLDRAKESIAEADDIKPAQKLVLETFLGALTHFISDADLDAWEEESGGFDAASNVMNVVDVTKETGKRPHSPFEITFPQAMIWGLMGVALGFAITLVRERTQGTLQRLRMAPISEAQVLGGKSLACLATCLLTMLFLLVFGKLVLGIRVGNVPLLLLAMVCTSFCFTGIMMTASVAGKTEQAVAGASWGAMMPFAMMGGGMIPLIAMPSWLITASNFSPFKWAIYSLEGAIWREFTLSEMIGPCVILLAIGVGFFLLGLFIYRKTCRS